MEPRGGRGGGMEKGKWKMENGKWKMENGKWKMGNGKWDYIILCYVILLCYMMNYLENINNSFH